MKSFKSKVTQRIGHLNDQFMKVKGQLERVTPMRIRRKWRTENPNAGVTGQNIPPAGVYPGILWPRPIYNPGYILA